MALKFWLGLVEGSEHDYGVAGNWYPSGVPAAGDEVIIGNTQYSILYGLDQSAVELLSFHVKKTFTGQIGTATSPLKIDASSLILLQGTGDCFLDVTTGDTDKVLVDRPADGTGKYHLSSGTTGKGVVVVGGDVFWRGNAALVYMTHDASEALPGRARFVLESGTVTLGSIMAGVFEQMAGTVSALVVEEGTAIVHEGVVTNLRVFGPGLCDYRSQDVPTTIQAWGKGTLTFANDSRAKELGDIYLYGVPTLDLNNGARNITVDAIIAEGVPKIIPASPDAYTLIT